jgi:hypothetical protein
VPYAILRPGPLSDAPGRGTIALADERVEQMPAVSREDVAEVAMRCLLLGVTNRTIGFVGGDVPIDDALDAPAAATA